LDALRRVRVGSPDRKRRTQPKAEIVCAVSIGKREVSLADDCVAAGSTVIRRLVGLMFDDSAAHIRGKIVAICLGLLALNGLAWAWAFSGM
jgi:hypothetical protein